MGYWLDADDNYYIGDKQSPGDTAVTERPFYTMTWDGSVWNYDLPATRNVVKQQYARDLADDVNLILEEGDSPEGLVSLIIYAFVATDVSQYSEHVSADTPVLDGYITNVGGTKADAATALGLQISVIGSVIGQVLGQKVTDFALIDAAGTGEAIRAITYARPF